MGEGCFEFCSSGIGFGMDFIVKVSMSCCHPAVISRRNLSPVQSRRVFVARNQSSLYTLGIIA